MAYFVEIKNGLVVNLIVINDSEIGTEFPNSETLGQTFIASLGLDGMWLQTSDSIRNQFAQIGYTYDSSLDQFIAPKPFESWTLNSNNIWVAPSSKPEGNYWWNESTLSWVAIPLG